MASIVSTQGSLNISVSPQTYIDALEVVPVELDFDAFPETPPTGPLGSQSVFVFTDLTVEYFEDVSLGGGAFPGLSILPPRLGFGNRFSMETEYGRAVLNFERPIDSFGFWVQFAETNGTISVDTGSGPENVEVDANIDPPTWPHAFVFTIRDEAFQTISIESSISNEVMSESFFYTFAVPEPSSTCFLFLSGFLLLRVRLR